MAKKQADKPDGDNVPDGARRLHQYVQRIERLNEEKKNLGVDIKAVYAEAESGGFDPTVLKAVVKRRQKTRSELEDWDAQLATYETNLDSIME